MNKLFGLALLMIGMVLAVGAGANFRYYSADRHASFDIVSDDNELIDLTAMQPYVKYSNGKLYVDISDGNSNRPSGGGAGLSPNTTYVFEEMFKVSNELWENNETDFPICVKVNTNHEQVKVFAGNYTSPIAGPASNIQFTVYHGNPVKVGMIFDTTNSTLGQEDFTMTITAHRGTCEP
ncbi:DUF1102 domain-containing protein [Thermococcus gammatolerans]|uniref:DUF1102 domain-containing protein n=1 Tax=Thermococcus gammatolerans (strain DSM 15229 / JCM 11827 / EJ3) TaxID=593117 RepID=C5A434_THEGJ|nr:DUF1102 domain-containing protein [Thermococcus gammatolerans]ACS32996.1 Conserved hypothetical protein [Thermococcus gammatolerans EJ3]